MAEFCKDCIVKYGYPVKDAENEYVKIVEKYFQ